jgi:hypothetical protein
MKAEFKYSQQEVRQAILDYHGRKFSVNKNRYDTILEANDLSEVIVVVIEKSVVTPTIWQNLLKLISKLPKLRLNISA